MESKNKNQIGVVNVNKPVPYLSENIVAFVTNKLKDENYDFLIEYGSGNSTRYFLSKLLKFEKQCTYISVEYHPGWFKELVKLIKSDFNAAFTSEEQFELRSWNYEKCKIFLHGKNASPLNIPSELKRLPKAKRAFGGLFNIKMLLHRMRKESRPIDGDYSVTI